MKESSWQDKMEHVMVPKWNSHDDEPTIQCKLNQLQLLLSLELENNYREPKSELLNIG